MDCAAIEESILATLQSAFDADPAAMRAMVVNRTPCNQSLADHPTIVVSPIPVAGPALCELGLVGLLVGIMCDLGCKRVVGWKFEKVEDDAPDLTMKFVGFALVERNPQPGVAA